MPKSPFEKLQTAVIEYGDAAMENFLRCRAFGKAVFGGLAEFMECDAKFTSMVPPEGKFDPSKDYDDEAFSFQGKGIIRLEPIAFGICIIVPNAEDSGSLWLRTAIRVEVTGDTFDVYVSNQPRVQVPLAFEGQLSDVYDTILQEYLSIFRKEIDKFHDDRYRDGIGFMPE